MSRTTAQVSFLDEIIVDSFAGGGGASTGIELATGRPVTIAINHDPDAILMHKTNHPYTEHYQASVWDVDPREVCQGRPVGLLWASPDCKHFSKAKGGKPVDKNIRGLAWIVLRWAGTVAPRVIMLENVEEFQTWGPVRKGRPVKSKAGQTFRQWLSQLEALGYAVEWRELVDACQRAPQHRYLFLTKNPARYLELDRVALLPHAENFWYGATVANEDAAAMYPMPWANINTFWSMEPLLGPVDMSAAEGLPQWVILGAETGNRMDKVKPRREWVDQIAEFCAENEIPVFYKDNLRAYFPDLPPSALPWSNQESATTEWAAHFMGRFERQV